MRQQTAGGMHPFVIDQRHLCIFHMKGIGGLEHRFLVRRQQTGRAQPAALQGLHAFGIAVWHVALLALLGRYQLLHAQQQLLQAGDYAGSTHARQAFFGEYIRASIPQSQNDLCVGVAAAHAAQQLAHHGLWLGMKDGNHQPLHIAPALGCFLRHCRRQCMAGTGRVDAMQLQAVRLLRHPLPDL